MKKRLMKMAARTAARNLVPALPTSKRKIKKDLRLAALTMAADWAMDRLGRKKRRPSYGAYAAKGLAAAAVAVPLGVWVGNRLRSE